MLDRNVAGSGQDVAEFVIFRVEGMAGRNVNHFGNV